LRLLVTGIAGFVGGHLVEYLRRERPDVEVCGLSRPHGRALSGAAAGVRLLEADLNDAASVEAALREVKPDRILHLAGQSSVHQSWLDPGGTLRTNVLGLVNLLEVLRRHSLAPDVLVVGSAEEYGLVEAKDLPVREDAPLLPSNPYAVSKAAQGLLAVEYAKASALRLVRTRTFHHTGPGRGEAFAESSFARQIAEIEAGLRPAVLHVGNLDAVRDFTDVRDVVRAYWALFERGEAGAVYNVCSGRGRRIHDLLDALVQGSRATVEVRVDPERLRRSDLPVLVGDPRKLREATGWEPRVPLEQSLHDLLEDWRRRVLTARPAVPSGSGSR
jgi:GDP-4-dehydro-6-deoxy-D-mannose reductase